MWCMLISAAVFLTLHELTAVSSEAIQYVSYTVENAVSYNGNNATMTSIGCDGIPLTCQPGSKLDDSTLPSGMNVVTLDNLQYEQFFAFSRQSAREQLAQFFFSTNYTDVMNIVIHFLNYPDKRIGLPSLSLHTEDSDAVLPFVFNDNHDLHSADNTVRNVTLSTSIPTAIDNIILNITFENHNNIDWLLLSEVDFYNDSNIIMLHGSPSSLISIGPNDLQSTASFTCTVINSGSFEWIWEFNGQQLATTTRYKIWIADATRSSQLVISELRYEDHGNYSCKVKRKEDDNNYYRYNKVFRLELRVSLKAKPNEVVSPSGSTVTLVCEAYGYLPSDIEWKRNGELITAERNYSLITSSGSIDSISSNGVMIKSQIISIQINKIDETHSGVYVCELKDLQQMNVTLTIGMPVTSPSSTEIVYCISSNVLLIQLLLTIVIGLILITTNVLCMEYCRRKNKTKMDSEDQDDMMSKTLHPTQRSKSLELPVTYNNHSIEPRQTKSLNEISYSMEDDLIVNNND